MQWPQIGPPLGIPFQLNATSPQARGLVAWWPTQGQQRANVLRDYVGKTNLTVSATSWRAFASVGESPNYNSTELTGTASGVLAGLTSFTLSAWVNADTLGFTTDIFSIYDEASRGWLWRIKDVRQMVFFSAGHGDTGAGASLNAGTLYHVAMSHDRSTRALRFYINGQLTGSATHFATFNMPNVGDPVLIGRDNYDGGIFDVRVYNYVKSDLEVLALWLPQTRWELYAPLWTPAYYAPPVVAGQPMALRQSQMLTGIQRWGRGF